MAQQLVKKLSLKAIVGRVDVKKLHEDNKEVDLFNIGGTCTGTKTGNSQYGEWNAFTGTFGAIRLDDGEVFRGVQLFLPEIAEAFVLPTVMESKGQPVEFAFIIGVKPAFKQDGSATYEYTVKPIQVAEVADPLDSMMGLLRKHAPAALEAPKATEGDAAPAVKGKK